MTKDRITRDRALLDALPETFVANGILRLATRSDVGPTFHHYPDKDQDEVDILEDESGDILEVQVKTAATVTARDFKPPKVATATGSAVKAVGCSMTATRSSVGDRLAAGPL